MFSRVIANLSSRTPSRAISADTPGVRSSVPSRTRTPLRGHRCTRATAVGLATFLTSFCLAASAEGQIRRDPNGVNVNSQGATTVFITFGGLQDQVPVEATWCGELIPATPDIGLRCDPSTIFGRLPIRFDQSRLTGSVFTDVMSIPPSVARRAYQAAARGETSSFFYVRRFVSTTGGPDEYVFVTCRLAGGGARVPLALTNVRIAFEGDRAVVGVPRGTPVPEFSAEIAYNGTGRLRGRWEVVLPGDQQPSATDLLPEASLPPEERALQRRYTNVGRFDVFLPPTGEVTVPGPPVDRLPTSVDGLYQVLLRVEASDDREADSNLAAAGAGTGVIHAGAVAGFPLPILRYSVGSAASAFGSGQLRLLEPRPGATAPSDSVTFRWAPIDDAHLYRLEIRDADGQELLSALLQQGIGAYPAPRWILVRTSGSTMRWRVVALDSNGEPKATTEWRELAVP